VDAIDRVGGVLGRIDQHIVGGGRPSCLKRIKIRNSHLLAIHSKDSTNQSDTY
jgi:hypothetical protein